MSPPAPGSRSAMGLAALLGVAGLTHFVLPRPFDEIVPRALPGVARSWTVVSGVAELALAGAIAHPRTRRWGATAAAVFFVAVLPANIQMAVDWRTRPWPQQLGAWARLPLQIPLVICAWRVRSTAAAAAPTAVD